MWGCELPELQPGATSVLDVFKDVTPAQAAEWAIDPYDSDKRYRGTLLLANKPFAGEGVYIKLFTDNINDPDAGVRMASVRALGNHGGPEHAPLLLKALKDPDKMVRAEAARALQRVHNPIAVEPLIKALDEKDEPEAEVRAEVADALGQYPENRVVAALLSALAEPNLAINYATVDSLRTLTGQDFGFDRVAWREWVDKTKDPFLAGSAYVYPAFHRSKRWYEYIPFVPGPPNEAQGASPVGLPPPDEPRMGG